VCVCLCVDAKDVSTTAATTRACDN